MAATRVIHADVMTVWKFKGQQKTSLNLTTKQLYDETLALTGVTAGNRSLQGGKALHVRDLRLIDPVNSVPCKPVIMVRERAIVVKLEEVRAIILHDALLLIAFQVRRSGRGRAYRRFAIHARARTRMFARRGRGLMGSSYGSKINCAKNGRNSAK